MNRAWTTADIAYLRGNGRRVARAIARELDISESAVRCAASRFRISFRQPRSRRGAVLGQPHGVSLRGPLRADLVSGRVDAQVLARRMQLDRDAALCPRCAARPIRVLATGLCRPCHLEALAAVHREALKELEAQRALWLARQQLQRAKVQASSGAGSAPSLCAGGR